MPSIVVINDEGSVLYQNVVEDIKEIQGRSGMAGTCLVTHWRIAQKYALMV